ncbi:DNA repair protein RecO [Deferrisoma palaeochoriense]
MTPRRTEAFVLRTRPLGETDRVADLLTADLGRVAVVAKGARRSCKRFGGLLDYFVRVRATLRPGRGELWRLEDVELVRDYGGVARDLGTHAAAAHVLEVAWLGTREAGPDRAVFHLVDAALAALAAGAEPGSLRRVFQARMLQALGWAPFGACPGCGGRIEAGGGVRDGAVWCRSCGGPEAAPLSAGALRTLEAAASVPLPKLGSVRFTRAAEAELGPFLDAALTRALGARPRTLERD